MSEELAEPQVANMLSGHMQVTTAKTNSRSILGSMNDLAFQIKSMVLVRGILTDADLSKINRQLNRIPMGAIKYKVGIDKLKQKLVDMQE